MGQGVRTLGWRNVADWAEVSQVTVTYDSLFKWDVASGMNLAPGTLARGGRILGIYEEASGDSTVEVSGPLPGLEHLIDGDPDTAFDPDRIGVPRLLRVRVDLGAGFSADRIRLFPRLDQDNRLRFPQLFKISTTLSEEDEGYVSTPLNFGSYNPNIEPVVERFFASRNARFVLLEMNGTRPWEIAELEVYGDGTVPVGVFQSIPMPARHTYPVWGKVRYEGGDISRLPVVVQTRTGPDRFPIQYFRRTGVGDDLEAVSSGLYNALPEEEQGPVRPNPDWSGWTTVTDGLVRSPGLNRYVQFRVFFSQPGTVLRNLIFEYVYPPVVQELRAEVDPRLVEAGQVRLFTLSATAHMLTARNRDNMSTGFRQLQVLTSAQIEAVEKVLVDDREEPHTARIVPGEGVTLFLGKRIDQDGTFVQILMRGAVFRDGTRFELRAVDRRLVERQLEEVYQTALEADVDPVSAGGELVVRLAKKSGVLQLDNASVASFCTPNGDGINDDWELAYDLLKLTHPARVRVEVFSLAGGRVRQVFAGAGQSGRHFHTWDGRDEEGLLVPPGLYLYLIQVEADQRVERRQGIVGVAY